jgi:Protein of unknown function (DUF1203)
MDFRIRGLPVAQFAGLFPLSDAELLQHHARRVVADRSPGFPCRVSLRDAAVGERVLLVNFEHLAVETPYRARYAIYVREQAADVQLTVNELPPVLNGRLLSLRAFNDAGMLLEADVAQDGELPQAIRRLLARRDVAYLHLHNARPGCYAARVERA